MLARSVEALRRLPPEKRPRKVLGCEVWRDLAWLVDEDKVALNSGRRAELAAELLLAFDSQISGKHYDLATLGRRSANATFHTSHAADRLTGITCAVDLTPLLADTSPSLAQFAAPHIDRSCADVTERIGRIA
ncbi:MAG TPA: hypothetical protein VHN79_12290 [Lacunisphaera sp.]|nr:hypothetical protein [Lacunisphaera sp.]